MRARRFTACSSGRPRSEPRGSMTGVGRARSWAQAAAGTARLLAPAVLLASAVLLVTAATAHATKAATPPPTGGVVGGSGGAGPAATAVIVEPEPAKMQTT